jgi:hypothetical protein
MSVDMHHGTVHNTVTNNGAHMQTLTANAFFNRDEHGPRSKFPHTGPVYYGSGKLPYTAALKGVELSGRNGHRLFKTAEAADKAAAREERAMTLRMQCNGAALDDIMMSDDELLAALLD